MVQYLKPVDSPHHAFAHGLHDSARDWQNNSVRIIVPGEPTGPDEVGTAQGIYLIGYVLGQRLARNVPGHLSQMDPGEHFRGYLSQLSLRKREQIYNDVLACALGGIGEAHPDIDPTPEDWAAARAETDRICGPLPGQWRRPMGWSNKSDLAAPPARFYKRFAAGVQDAAEGRRARQLVSGLCTQPGELPLPGAVTLSILPSCKL